jgi:small conductance mechanosensitive channel
MIGAVRVLAASTTTTTTPATASNASNSDRGVIHQLFFDLGATQSAAHTAQIYLDAPLKVVVILVVAVVVTRLVSRISRRMVNGMRLVSPLVQASPRGTARVKTLGGAFTSVFRAVIWVIALLEILNEFSINLAPFVATATVIGAALGFGAQTLVKDFLSGILILAEDQYGVGDHVAVGVGSNATAGTVESVNLRVTRLRGADGGILYVPNGDIRILSNDTETDSQALVDVMVPFGTDLVAAGVAAQEAARELAADPEWTGEFVSEPYFAGVQDATNATGFVVRIMALTRPGQHLRMAREMRLRIIERLRRQGIAWAGPDAAPPELRPEEIDRARAEKREAEEETAEKLDGPAVRRPVRRPSERGSGKAAAARAAVAKRVSTRKPAEGTRSPEPESGQPGSREHEPGSGEHQAGSREHEEGGAPNP